MEYRPLQNIMTSKEYICCKYSYKSLFASRGHRWEAVQGKMTLSVATDRPKWVTLFQFQPDILTVEQ